MPEFIVESEARDERATQLEPRGVGAPPPPAQLLDLLQGDERPARVELRRQIARLEAELAELFTSAFPRLGISYDVTPAGGPRILDMGELEQVRDSLLERVTDVRAVLSDRSYVEDQNRAFLQKVIAEPERYHWVRISNEDIGEPGCRHWHSKPRFGVLGMLMGWWRVKLSSGCPLASAAAKRRISGSSPDRLAHVRLKYARFADQTASPDLLAFHGLAAAESVFFAR